MMTLDELRCKIEQAEKAVADAKRAGVARPLEEMKILGSLLEKEVLLLKQAEAAILGPTPQAKTVVMVVADDLYGGGDVKRYSVTFPDKESFKEYLRSIQNPGVFPVEVDGDKQLVNSFEELAPGGTYTHALCTKEAFDRVLGETMHLQQSRVDEFAVSLTNHAQREEPDQGYLLREDLRMQLTREQKIAEHDVVVLGKDKAWVGSHKTYARGAKPVKEIADRCKDLAELPNALPSIVQPAFMAELLERGARPIIDKACLKMKVVRFHRSGLAIQVVSCKGAAGKLLRL